MTSTGVTQRRALIERVSSSPPPAEVPIVALPDEAAPWELGYVHHRQKPTLISPGIKPQKRVGAEAMSLTCWPRSTMNCGGGRASPILTTACWQRRWRPQGHANLSFAVHRHPDRRRWNCFGTAAPLPDGRVVPAPRSTHACARPITKFILVLAGFTACRHPAGWRGFSPDDPGVPVSARPGAGRYVPTPLSLYLKAEIIVEHFRARDGFAKIEGQAMVTVPAAVKYKTSSTLHHLRATTQGCLCGLSPNTSSIRSRLHEACQTASGSNCWHVRQRLPSAGGGGYRAGFDRPLLHHHVRGLKTGRGEGGAFGSIPYPEKKDPRLRQRPGGVRTRSPAETSAA